MRMSAVEENASSTAASTIEDGMMPGTADVPWSELGFEFRPTKSHLKMVFKDGAWGPMELCEDPYMKVHVGATALHYGQSAFEGLKAFAHEDNKVYLFRPEENAKRMQSSADRVMMAPIPEDMFVEACKKVVRDNIAYVPPYGSGGALYLRPLLFGSGSRIGLQPADEYTFIILVIPVGDYYKGGLSQTVHSVIVEGYDRAAKYGVGNVKVAGNYAADMLPNYLNKKAGYPISLYLDSEKRNTVEEFSTSNFIGINKSKKIYATPKSTSVLPSITNKSLMQLAKDAGYDVQQRDVPIEELEEFDEIIACGTAVIVTSVGKITNLSTGITHEYSDEVPDVTKMLYEKVKSIQFGESPDLYGWNVPV
jgi:branched-chain amino acid aminotransferase